MRWAAAVLAFGLPAGIGMAQVRSQVVVAVPLPIEGSGVSQLPVTRFWQGQFGAASGANPWLPYQSMFYPGFSSGFYGGSGIIVRSLPQNTPIPSGPSYANPGPAAPVAEQAAPLEAPKAPNTEDWADVRSSFASASASVSSARAALEELRSRLAALGQSPRANLIANVATAEAALKQAQAHISAASLTEAREETQRAAYIARQVLKEFGR